MPAQRLLSTKEAAKYLGMSKTSFRVLGLINRLPRLGWGEKKDLFDIQDLDKLIDDRKKAMR